MCPRFDKVHTACTFYHKLCGTQVLNVCDGHCPGSSQLRLPLVDGICLLIISFLQAVGAPAAVFGCPCRKQDNEQGRLIDQVTSETSGVVEGLRMKQQSVKHKELQTQQLRGQVLPISPPQA